ncbi:RNA-directed DNA polymerase from mobile element jockey [Folsomia candida]|uniref:RNA-directed DNA polymerase from mobile element jockey n=1 Tax=Folsomia candida TaxID=158441 RepID=A0A226DD11_FOLCA|nr:RNA-directed DNA polymerase from mobile element jockey [Folsomia candida]
MHFPWFDVDCQTSAIKIKQSHKQARSNNWDIPHTDLYHQAKQKHKKLGRQKQRAHFSALREKLSQASNSHDFWKCVIKPFRSKPFVLNAITQEAWESFYNIMQTPRVSDDTTFSGAAHPLLDAPFTRIDLLRAIQKISNNKAPGVDGIPNEFLKSLPLQGIDLLVDCYNDILENESLPEEWSRSITVMIHKKGDKLNPNNYRPIALLSCLLKLFTQLLQHRLSDWADKCSIIPEAQGGFRRQRGCDDQIFLLNAAINIGTRNKGKVYACFFDFARAFPSVPHDKLWKKLNDLGVSPKFIRILRKIYEKFATQIRMTEGLSDAIDITEGLGQGCVLSPLLFSLYTADIEQTLKDLQAEGIQITAQLALHILLYADDMIVMSPSPQGLQMKIRCLTRFFDLLALKVHLDKTKIIVFRRGGNIKKGLNFTYKGETIEIVKQYTYLGVPLSSSGLFHIAAQHFKKKGLTALGSTWNIFTRARLEALPKKYQLFQSLVTSTALYGAHIWSLRYLSEIEKIQYQFHHRLLGLPHGTPSYALRLELDRPSMTPTILAQSLRYLIKILDHPSARYTSQCLQALQARATYNQTSDPYNWFQQIVALLTQHAPSLSMQNLTSSALTQAMQGILDASKLQQRSEDINRVTNSERFNYYSHLTPKFQTAAAYTSVPIPLRALRLIAQCRLGQGTFYTPLGMLHINYNETCNFCNKIEPQSLWHILCSCPLNIEPRNAFFSSTQIPTSAEFSNILNPTTKEDV